MVRLAACALLGAVFMLSACGGGVILRDAGKAKGLEVITACDAPEAGVPGTMRFYVHNMGGNFMTQGEWKINGKTYTSNLPGSDVFIIYDQNGVYNASFRGVDKNGNDCTGPKVKFTARRGSNAQAALVVDGAYFVGEGEEPQADGTSLRYHEWRWTTSRSYDPDGSDRFTSVDWEVWTSDENDRKLNRIAWRAGGETHDGDTDGDGINDIVITSVPGADYNQFSARFFEANVSDTEMLILSVNGQSDAGYRKGWDGCIYGNGTPSKGTRPIKK